MRIKPINKFIGAILPKTKAGITLAPFAIYLREPYLNDPIKINEEKIHWRQEIELLIIFYYLWYPIEWLFKLPLNGRYAYDAISFEREAKENREDLLYLYKRKPYASIKRLFN